MPWLNLFHPWSPGAALVPGHRPVAAPAAAAKEPGEPGDFRGGEARCASVNRCEPSELGVTPELNCDKFDEMVSNVVKSDTS